MTASTLSPLSGWNLSDWAKAYQSGQTPQQLLPQLLQQIREEECDNGKPVYGSPWITLATDAVLAQQLASLEGKAPASLPLFGVPFAVKDNIDVAGFATTGGCPEFAFTPQRDATVVALLRAAGAVVIGKTNLDQFATGLVGARSPYGPVANSFKPEYVSGGSSSGSAVTVARGQVAFSLGTDTAGSGRVPAGFNHLVGVKATKGLVSTNGVIPACKSLDVVSIFALNSRDAEQLLDVAAQFDAADPYSRESVAVPQRRIKRLAIPLSPQWFGDVEQQQAYEQACVLARKHGLELVEKDFGPLFEMAALLYQGPWVAERYAAVGEFMEQDLPGLDPIVKSIVLSGKLPSAVDQFRAEYRRLELMRYVTALFDDVDALFVPTSPHFPTHAALAEQPIEVNSRNGVYTNFVNLADLSALSLPAALRRDGLPFGITLIAPAWQDRALLAFANRWEAALKLPEAPVLLGRKADESVVIAVVGAHLSGMPLNHQLSHRSARLVEQTVTADKYRLYALANTTPPKPGLVRVGDDEQGVAIIVELWQLTAAAFGSFVNEVPQPMGIGKVELEDGRIVNGFMCEAAVLPTATDISEFGGWRAYVSREQAD